LQFALYRWRLVGIEEFPHRHPPYQTRIGFAGQHRVELDALLNDKVFFVVAVANYRPLVAFIAAVGTTPEYQRVHWSRHQPIVSQIPYRPEMKIAARARGKRLRDAAFGSFASIVSPPLLLCRAQ
jgi:hypothetical protein